MRIRSQIDHRQYYDVEEKRKTQVGIHQDHNYNYYSFCGCCGSRYCSPEDSNSVKYFNEYNHGIQLMVNPGDVPITQPTKGLRGDFELVKLDIEGVNLLFKLSKVDGKKYGY